MRFGGSRRFTEDGNTVFIWFLFLAKPNLAENLFLFVSIYVRTHVYVSQYINQRQMLAKNLLTRSAAVWAVRRVLGRERSLQRRFFGMEKGEMIPLPRKPSLPAALGLKRLLQSSGLQTSRGPLKAERSRGEVASAKACLSFHFYFTTYRGSAGGVGGGGGRPGGDIKHRPGNCIHIAGPLQALREAAGQRPARHPAGGTCHTHTHVFGPKL